MAQARSTVKRRSAKARYGIWPRIIKGLIVSIVVTLVGVLVFALLMQWIKPSDEVIRIFNQVLKLLAIVAGVWACVGKGGEKGLLRGAAVGLLYMACGVFVYALLSGQQLPITAYLADLGMGVAGGGITGMILSNLTAK